ncbi:MAG: tail fiber protein [Sideroxydans sp.]|nr:tail fiber protein [Sideroxydans sp.]
MSQAFVGEIRMLPYTFPPMGWAWCNGQQMSIQTSAALYAVIGFIFGGDQRNYFNLPNLQGLTPMHAGSGSGLTPRAFASTGGAAVASITLSQMPNHTHTISGDNKSGTQGTPSSAVYPAKDQSNPHYKLAPSPATMVAMGVGALAAAAGGAQSHNNVQSYQVVNHCICLEGVFPMRN